MKKLCELCKGLARIHCDSDQASLCWKCDAMVHSANFLVARHSRNLLCNVCQTLMPWSASGNKLKIVVSVCEPCHIDGIIRDENGDEDEEDAAEEVEQNHVVPRSPPSPESSSSSDESRSDDEVVVSR